MNTSTIWRRSNILRGGSLALFIGALTAMTSQSQAAELDPITISTPISKTLAPNAVTELPVTSVTVNAKIAVDMDTLKNDSGVVLLKDRIAEAASDACYAANPFAMDDGSCVHNAVKAARPQMDAAIARARAMG